MRIGVFGGSFNPPHVGHVLGAHYALLTQELDQVLVLPVYQHPFGKPLAPFADRLAMCRIAFQELPRVVVSELERELGGESRTLRLIETLTQQHRDWQLRLIIGEDILAEADKWFGFEQVMALAPPLVLPRGGRVGDKRILPDVSSTDIRQAMIAGAESDAGQYIPAGVRVYVSTRRLYAGKGI